MECHDGETHVLMLRVDKMFVFWVTTLFSVTIHSMILLISTQPEVTSSSDQNYKVFMIDSPSVWMSHEMWLINLKSEMSHQCLRDNV